MANKIYVMQTGLELLWNILKLISHGPNRLRFFLPISSYVTILLGRFSVTLLLGLMA